MARTWKLASGDVLITRDDSPALVFVVPQVPVAMPLKDQVLFMRQVAEALERAGQAFDEGKLTELAAHGVVVTADKAGEKPS